MLTVARSSGVVRLWHVAGRMEPRIYLEALGFCNGLPHALQLGRRFFFTR
jgi:hypothetical protein